MKKRFFISLAGLVALGACGARTPAAVEDNVTVYENNTPAPCADAAPTTLRYSMPNGNDLRLETPRTVIQIAGRPGVSYGYYVWTGDRDYSDDPDLVVEDGTAYILTED